MIRANVFQCDIFFADLRVADTENSRQIGAQHIAMLAFPKGIRVCCLIKSSFFCYVVDRLMFRYTLRFQILFKELLGV